MEGLCRDVTSELRPKCDKMGGGSKWSAQRGVTKSGPAGRRPVLYCFKDPGVQLGKVSMGGSHGEI